MTKHEIQEFINNAFGECDNCGPVTLCWSREVRTIHTESGIPCAFGGGKGFHDEPLAPVSSCSVCGSVIWEERKGDESIFRMALLSS
jgi:ribosomal protein S27E